MKDTCGCCEGVQVSTPLLIANRPGLDTLAYRIGTHATFFASMQARLSTLGLSLSEEEKLRLGITDSTPRYPLRALTTRDRDDPAIAFLDAWATVADILTFYQERIANEGYLRTATERRSVLELARLVGYKLRPGVAASVYLAYTLEDGREVTIPQGSRAQSVPGPGEKMQSFETEADLEARGAWNALRPRTTRPQDITPDNAPATLETVYFKGTATNLKANDRLLFVFDDGVEPQGYVRRIESVEVQAPQGRTKVALQVVLNGDQFRQAAVNVVNDYLSLARLETLGITIPGAKTLDDVFRVLDQSQLLSAASLIRQSAGASGVEPAGTLLGPILLTLGAAKLAESTAIALLSKAANTLHLSTGLCVSLLLLREIQQSLNDDRSSPADRYLAIRKRLSCFRDARYEATKEGRLQEAAWIDGVVENLEKVANRLAPGERAPKPASPAGRGEVVTGLPPLQASVALTTIDLLCNAISTNGGQDSDPLKALQALLGPLSVARSVPPADSTRLNRSFGDSFGLNGKTKGAGALTDARSGLLLDVRPDLDRRRLYAALRNAAVAPPAAVKVYAFRKRAFVFGNNALPIPFRERRLSSQEVITISCVLIQAEGSARLRTTISIDEFQSNPIDIPLQLGPFSVRLPDEVVTVSILNTEPGKLKLTFEFLSRKATITVTQDPAQATGRIEGDATTEIVTFKSINEGKIDLTAKIQFVREVETRVSLDALYDQVRPGGWIVLEKPRAIFTKPGPDEGPPVPAIPKTVVTQVNSVSEATRTDYGLSLKGTQVELKTRWLSLTKDKQELDDFSTVRNTTVYAQSELLELADEEIDPVEQPVEGDEIELDGVYDGLQPGRWLIVGGERIIPGSRGVLDSELVMLNRVEHTSQTKLVARPTGDPVQLPGDKVHSVLYLAAKLAYRYKRDTVTISGNVVEATHGETISGPSTVGSKPAEVLGSGTGSQPMQQFALRQAPLTYVAAPNTTGTSSTLEVYVNNTRWEEADNLLDLQETDRGYVTQTCDDDKTTVIFGDGHFGARLPTGVENVKATYRFGIGQVGNVKAGQISLLATRPLGVKGVVNPQNASGGADRESRDAARRNTPRGLGYLDHLVSVKDYEDFARAFAGIGKARALRTARDGRPLIRLVLAGADDAPIDLSSQLVHNLMQALRDLGDPTEPIEPQPREKVALVIEAHVAVEVGYVWEDVAPKIQAALLDAFGFARRDLGQPAFRSEAARIIQQVEGVEAVHLAAFTGFTPDALAGAKQPDRNQPMVDVNPNQIAYLSMAVKASLILQVLDS